ncbi:MAG: hypothetical protein IH571_07565 [Acholeplasmataceae bacterium]|nr:hypothetical protein [Acholeplasmataceae bacterium]
MDIPWIVIFIVLATFLLIFLLSMLFSARISQRRGRLKTETLDLVYLNNLYEALGGAHNISNVSVEHQRLKVSVNAIKDIDANRLKSLEIPAVLAGKEVKLLIKSNTQEVLSYINQRRKEGD